MAGLRSSMLIYVYNQFYIYQNKNTYGQLFGIIFYLLKHGKTYESEEKSTGKK